MKKNVWAKILSLALVLACVFSLAACGGNSNAAGSYRLQTIEISGISMDLEQLAETTGVSADDLKVILELKSDGSLALDMSAIDDSMSMAGTWSESGSNITLTIDGETMTVPLKDGVITISAEGMSMTFKK